jgi:D-alanyl-D-alanine carboxypeptidase (penicillin-binding protein 5/6)
MLILVAIVSIQAINAEDAIQINASAAVLIDAGTGETIYEKNPHIHMAPASTTKIMTAIIAIEHGDLEHEVKISANAASTPGSSMRLRRGEKYSLHQLLYGLLLPSGNDAATAIAEYIAGSEVKFAGLMNEKAKELGMADTHFKNASGLPAEGHYSTAYDLALLARYALENPVFAAIVQTKFTSVPVSRSKVKKPLTNHNKLLWQYPYTTGIKTGYTRKAGRCLVASATQKETSLISVVLKSGTMYNDSISLFNFGFKNKLPENNPVQPPTSPAEPNLENQTNVFNN